MKLRSRLLYLFLISLTVILSCSDPKEKQLLESTQNKNYSQLMSLFSDELSNGNTGILKRPVDGNPEPSDSTVFVRAAITLLSSSTYSASNTGELILNNKNTIRSFLFLVREVIDFSYENGKKTPEHLDSFLFRVYREQLDELDEDYKSKLDQLIRTDTVYVDRIKVSILRELNTSKDLTVIGELLDLAAIEIPNNLIEHIEQKQQELESVRELSANRSSRISGIQTRIERLENKYGSELIRQARESYRFEGYMVAQLNQIANFMMYEVRDMSRNTYVLFTRETRFSSRGFFSLRVVKGGDLPMKTTESYGSFDSNFPTITEVTDEWYQKYLLYLQEVDPLERELRALRSGTDFDVREERILNELEQLRSELFSEIRNKINQ